ncbi:MAG: TerB family tellurite resistance protein [Myxococcota bacterium]|jgi:tellurite resistance protein|nr:TerB family tellurite resistance protein [Myxococcota bacterium]
MNDTLADYLDAATRRNLLKLACHAAWSDLEVVPEERVAVLELAAVLAVGEEELAEVRSWLDHAPEEFDPAEVAPTHRELFLDTLMAVVLADGRFVPEECQTLQLISALLR